VENAALAVAAAHVLGASPESVARGIADVRWPARVEVVSSAPRVVIDGAHNPAAIKRLVEAIQPLRGGEPLAIVFGVMEDHNPTAQLDELRQLEPQTLITTSANSPRAADPVQLADLWGSGALVVPIPAEALLAAKAQVGPSGMVLVCGSLYLAGEIYP
jgi:dihydrofolate synthase/folylpolyglutamate synthase